MSIRWKESVRWSCERIAARSDRPVSGCTQDEVLALEERLSVKLPAAYVLFLQEVGKSPGDFLLGTHLALDKLEFLQRDISVVMAESGASLRGDGFCFASNPSYVFLWFRTGEDDPAVHLYEEGWKDSRLAVPSFSSWLENSVAEQWNVVRKRT